MSKFFVVWRRGVEPLLYEEDFWNCIPRYWSHVSDGFMSMVAGGVVIDPSSEFAPFEAFIILTHVEEIHVEHVLALACIMRHMEVSGVERPSLDYATTYGALPPVVLKGVLPRCKAIEYLEALVNNCDTRIEEVEADSTLDAILKAFGYR